MDYMKQEVFNLDGNTQLEFINRKTIVIIDKDRFSICKQLLIENANDDEFAEFLNIPVEKVRYFKYKMQLFEESIRARRRAAKLDKRRQKSSKGEPNKKREMSSEERFRRARDLISRNMSTNQISKILKVSERSVTRFKRRMREEKRRLKAEGKIDVDPNDPDDENSFKHLPTEDKIRTAKELFRKRLKIQEISEILKISERSVRRWKDKLGKVNEEAGESSYAGEFSSPAVRVKSTRNPKAKRLNLDETYESSQEAEEEDEEDDHEPFAQPIQKKRRLFVDREKVQYARELIDNKLSNKEMAMLLEMSIACVRKLKLKILNGTVDELIDDSEEHYSKVTKHKSGQDGSSYMKDDADPLHSVESYSSHMRVNSSASNSFGYERKPKVVLGDREMLMVRLLRQNNIRTMDIAKLMKISERSVTRLLARSKDMSSIEYEEDFVAEVDKLLAEKDEILNSGVSTPERSQSFDEEPVTPKTEGSKLQVANSLLAMNVKVKDIAKMLDVSEKTVQKWKSQFRNEPSSSNTTGHPDTNDFEIMTTKEVDDVVYEVYGKIEDQD